MTTREEIVQQADLLGYRGEKKEEYLKQEFTVLVERAAKKEEAEHVERKEELEAERAAKIELEKMRLETEMKMLQTKIQTGIVKDETVSKTFSDASAKHPKLPHFQDGEDDLDIWLTRFESDPEKKKSLRLTILRDEIDGREVDVMRDTGCEGVVVRRQLVDAGPLTGPLTGERRTKFSVTSAGLGGDVIRNCRSCNVCQRTVKNGIVPRVPLEKVPLVDTPLKRVAMDTVGPINPPSEAGHRFILTLIDYATRYAEAVPLRKIDTETVAEALVDIYSRLGVPEEVLSDQGTQFM
ncbi:Gypsy retrotransposon integrase-like protein 1 [Elysia marginata]|uniref:Gypsy retrotransposon integrase-like protein 1 n=1 Tax=Elysia marginata TaxID=1093978 RepID=A0AAV4FR33_9GAST|nr:Gypsy retrotransposon integrase-like protein 1 [Elysia marginata]